MLQKMQDFIISDFIVGDGIDEAGGLSSLLSIIIDGRLGKINVVSYQS
jgi:hypothetical protein